MKSFAFNRLSALFLRKRMAEHYVFVYGTLKRGEPNHNWLTKADNGFSKFVSVAETVQKFPLVIASKYNIPFLLDDPGKGENVVGEVFKVDDRMLAALDILEDHPTFYIRDKTSVQLMEKEEDRDSNTLECWVYFLRKFKPELLLEKSLKEYRSCGSHGKPYAEKESRDPNYHARSDVLIS